jgi:hypothetical protein
MPFMPFAILGIWFRGLLALGLLGGGIWLLATWYDGLPRVTPMAQTDPDDPRPARPLSFGERVAQWQPALSWETAALGGGLRWCSSRAAAGSSSPACGGGLGRRCRTLRRPRP